ncbi:MAG: hypothetical protein DWQ29_08080 [Planctomycetota bacterium]|nr:MAG: hypothetical protein DWQ29_08080 [Planctomycetota bacterium]
MSHEPTFQEIVSTLKQERDELALKMHLAGAEAKQEWEGLRGKLDSLLASYDPARTAATESAGKVGDAMKSVANEIKEGFQRIRQAL